MTVQLMQAELPLRAYAPNLARMLTDNTLRFADRPVYKEMRNGHYAALTWLQLHADIGSIQSALAERGLRRGDRVAIVSRNRREMLELELAVMSMGAVAVPIFPAYTPEQTETLVQFCEPRFVAVAEPVHFDKIGAPERYEGVIAFEPVNSGNARNVISFEGLLHAAASQGIVGHDVSTDAVCLMMYTSGTMGKPKCVQLTHRNILSQQAAGKELWPISEQDRLLSYLPWHHSYGGIFEKYSALVNGAVLHLEHGYGKNIDTLLENWGKVQPTVFFSVPMIYQALVTRARQNAEIERLLFRGNLRFVFTAAAPLPKALSDEFESRGIHVLEGWGLTETSPCCTVTRHGAPRQPGVVGKPIPGVQVKLEDDGEILVKGPNVMTGYFKNPEETSKVFTKDGWFRTGDVGEINDLGLKLISRKDRIFKLSNAEKVVPSEIETVITHECPYLAWAFVTGSGRDQPVALLFPNRAMFAHITEDARLPSGCQFPRNVTQLAACLDRCLCQANSHLDAEFCRVNRVMLIDHELTIEAEELTPSMKLAPNTIYRAFKANIERLYALDHASDEVFADPVYIIRLDK